MKDTIPQAILKILRARHPIEPPMAYLNLRSACVVDGLPPDLLDFDISLHSLCETGDVEAHFARNGPGKMQAAYTATAKRATQTETLIGDSHED